MVNVRHAVVSARCGRTVTGLSHAQGGLGVSRDRKLRERIARPTFPRVQDLLRVQDWLLPAAVPVP